MTEQLSLNTRPLPLKLRIEDYLALDRLGAFEAYAKTELIEGEIFYMNAQHRPHVLLKMEIYDRLRDSLRGLGSDLRPLVEASVAMPDNSAPEPDIVLTNEASGEGLVPVASVALVVEVSDTTLETDLGAKAALYARHSIPEYWVADLRGRTIHRLRDPREGTYRDTSRIAFGEPVEAATVEGLRIETEGL